jgi:NhaA family Na+:H+ antiporter
MNFKHLFGVSLLGGLGFTMSLFIANLAYLDYEIIAAAKMGVIFGSIVAGSLGYLVLRLTLKTEDV